MHTTFSVLKYGQRMTRQTLSSQPTQTKPRRSPSRWRLIALTLVATCFAMTAWAQGEPIILEGFGPTRTVEFSPDGSMIAIGFQVELSLWDVRSGQKLREFQMLPEPYEVGTLAFSPDGKLLVGGDKLGSVTLWNIDTGRIILDRFWVPDDGPNYGTTYVVTAVAFSPDGKQLAAMRGGALTFWDVETGEMIRRAAGTYPSIYGSGYGNLVYLDAEGRRVWVSGQDRVHPGVYDTVAGGGRLHSFPGYVALSHDRTKAFIFPNYEMESVCELIDVNTGAVLLTFSSDCRGSSPSLSPDAKRLFYLQSGRLHLQAHLEELTTAERVPLRTYTPADTGEYGMRGTRFSPTGNHVLARTYEKVFLWDVSDLTSCVKNAPAYKN